MPISKDVIDSSSPGNFEKSEYTIEQLVYPSSLPGKLEAASYVVFYINTESDPKLDESQTNGTVVNKGSNMPGVGMNLSQSSLAQGLSQMGSELQAGAQFVGDATGISSVTKNVLYGASGLGKILGNGLSETADLMSIVPGVDTMKQIANTLGAKATAALSEVSERSTEIISAVGDTVEATFSKPMKRLKSAIVLYQPNNISRNVTANWEDSDLGMMGRMFNGNDIAAAKATMEQGDNQARGSYLMTLLPLAILGNSDLGNLVSTKTRRIMSPSRAQVFKGVSYRNFSFEFVFAPVTPEETTNVDNIIKTFRKNMLPTDMTSRGQPMLWKYPNTFDIVHYARGRVNPHIPKISTCALVSCDVNYTPSGQWNELGGKSNMSGAPAQIQMQLVFQELELLTSDRIDQGF